MRVDLPRASAADIPTIMSVMVAAFDPSFGEAWSMPQLSGTLSMPGSWARLALVNDAVAGFTLCRRIDDAAELLLIAVDPAHRGGPTAARLIAGALHDAASGGAGLMFLEVRAGNKPALQLYERHDFIAVGRRRDYYTGRDGRRYDAITMRRVLDGGDRSAAGI